ncbi:MAG: DUF3795 domain-containing protein [Dehalococcoidia bacterium]|jgi:hypothetical protein
MEKILAYCGIVCTDCEAFIATLNDDDAKRKEVAEEWTQKYSHNFKPEDINCEGCLTTAGKVFGYCNICEIRKCGRERKVINCAYCDDYACDKLVQFFNMAPMCQTTLDEIREGL